MYTPPREEPGNYIKLLFGKMAQITSIVTVESLHSIWQQHFVIIIVHNFASPCIYGSCITCVFVTVQVVQLPLEGRKARKEQTLQLGRGRAGEKRTSQSQRECMNPTRREKVREVTTERKAWSPPTSPLPAVMRGRALPAVKRVRISAENGRAGGGACALLQVRTFPPCSTQTVERGSIYVARSIHIHDLLNLAPLKCAGS